MAIIRFKSFCTNPEVAAKKAVVAPTRVITNRVVGLNSSIGEDLNNKYIPAVTRVQNFYYLFVVFQNKEIRTISLTLFF
jgi:hypothetical protein